MDETRFVRVSYAFRNARETGVSYAFRRGLTGDRVNKPFLPSYVPVGGGLSGPATCFACGQPFNPTAYGSPKLRCRVCELIGVEIQPEGRKG